MVGFVSFMDKPKFINKCLQKKVAFPLHGRKSFLNVVGQWEQFLRRSKTVNNIYNLLHVTYCAEF